MPTLELSEQQVVEPVKQLPAGMQTEVLKTLLTGTWNEWGSLTRVGEDRIRIVAAERGLDWHAMTEDEREAFVGDLLHEESDSTHAT